jgi:pSer/pThr/pTyr-binding forkhead associated (FHA) protein
MADPIEVLLKFAFLGVLFLFLLWVARSALKDLGRPAPDSYATAEGAYRNGDGLGAGGSAGRLVVEQGGGLSAGQVFIVGAGLVIGRAPTSEIRIDDGFASARHARVFARDGAVYVEDMSSTNGTYLNGKRLSALEQLNAADRIRIGDTEFRYEP